MTHIVIADDHTFVRAGLKQVLNALVEIQSLREVSNGHDVFTALREAPCDVLILDINLGDQSGLEVLKQVRQQHPEVAVLILTMHSEKQYATRMLKAGAAGFLNKGSAAEELVNAVRKIAQGGKYITQTLAEQLVMDMGKAEAEEPHKLLSDREFEVFRLIAKGEKNKAIAQHLFLSEKTISTYQSRILEKMNLENRSAIIHYALKNKLV